MKRIIPVTFVFCIFTMGAWVTLAAQPNQTSGKKNQGAQKEQPAPITTFINNEETANTPNKADENPPSFYASFKKPEGMLVVVGLITCILISWQAWETRRAAEATKEATEGIRHQVELMDRQTESIHHQAVQVRRQTHILIESAKATKVAAEASKLSADALVASERAWIDGEIVTEVVAGALRYRLKVFNHGKTPAHIHRYEILYGCCIEDDYIEPLKSIGGSHYQIHTLLGSNGDSTMEEPVYLDSMSNSCERWGVCRVTITYTDLIMPGKNHQTYFIYRYDKLTTEFERFTFRDSYN